ncbi:DEOXYRIBODIPYRIMIDINE PHOTOLYASE [Salix purpurea]|uniref:Deoxyribodipyrimidine photo-lyase n=1 Tax=Salix purpurea TaxID=77065 RepID=A0A9Q0TIM6_SALPP|nr:DEOXYRIBODIPYRIMIDINE PHOTOLYASE [Salix purpurea]
MLKQGGLGCVADGTRVLVKVSPALLSRKEEEPGNSRLSLPSNLRTLAHVVLRYSASIAHVSKHCSSSALFFSNMASLSSPATHNTTVQPGRIRVIKEGSKRQVGDGPVVYWMFRDQRLRDNWALIHAVDQANRSNVPLQSRIEETLQIPFFLFQGEAEETIPAFLRDCGASLLVTDFSPLRQFRTCQNEICKRVSDSVTIHEVDAHNIVPIRVASEKLEYSARTLRGKINKLLPEYLIDFPMLQQPNNKWVEATNQSVDWNNLIDNVSRKGAEVPEIKWCEPGEDAAMEVLMGSTDGFLTKRLKNYSTDRNNPLKPKGLSGLSPYLHFGQVSAQRCALEARKVRNLSPQSADAFLEELIVRRELADNFCFYQPNYDSIHGAWEWARKTLADHASDKREHIYSKEQLEKAQTADPLWNASQLEMVCHGKMHGFMRMYWAKKILEWTRGPEEALAIAIYLNDKYEIDGRDPSGYVGCMWSICGIHDQGWKERPIFGKIRYMNYAGCKRKFDVDGYITYVKRIVGDIKKRKAENELHKTTKELLG